jgi:hypothetical protein
VVPLADIIALAPGFAPGIDSSLLPEKGPVKMKLRARSLEARSGHSTRRPEAPTLYHEITRNAEWDSSLSRIWHENRRGGATAVKEALTQASLALSARSNASSAAWPWVIILAVVTFIYFRR